tara:strand:+ start:151 stop:399 length:249 start_codon:yes stop_codon:yes gene_type:complete
MAYLNTCATCHGGNVRTAGIIPDLRRSGTISDRDAFYAVVGEGILADRGMISFSENYTREEIEAIRAYIVSRANTDKERRQR